MVIQGGPKENREETHLSYSGENKQRKRKKMSPFSFFSLRQKLHNKNLELGDCFERPLKTYLSTFKML